MIAAADPFDESPRLDRAGTHRLTNQPRLVGFVAVSAILLTVGVLAAAGREKALQAIALLAAVGVITVLLHRGRGLDALVGAPSRWVRRLVSQLLPTLLLGLALPLQAAHSVGLQWNGVTLDPALRALALSVPWLGQIACMPLYNSLSRELPASPRVVAAKLLGRFPLVLGVAALVAVVFVVVTLEVLHLPLSLLAPLVAVEILNVVFMQAMVLPILCRLEWLWATAWLAYAAGVMAEPRWPALPAALGAATLVLYAALVARGRWQWTWTSGIGLGMLQGAGLGGVLWADKLVLFLAHPSDFPIGLAFLAAGPGLVGYLYYFGRYSGGLDVLVQHVQSRMTGSTAERFERSRATLVCYARSSAAHALLLAAALAAVLLALAPLIARGSLILFLAMTVSGWAAAIVAVLAYKLVYLGRTVVAYCGSGAYALLVVLAADVFLRHHLLWVAAAQVVAAVALLAWFLRETWSSWSSPEYHFFWKKAIAW